MSPRNLNPRLLGARAVQEPCPWRGSRARGPLPCDASVCRAGQLQPASALWCSSGSLPCACQPILGSRCVRGARKASRVPSWDLERRCRLGAGLLVSAAESVAGSCLSAASGQGCLRRCPGLCRQLSSLPIQSKGLELQDAGKKFLGVAAASRLVAPSLLSCGGAAVSSGAVTSGSFSV